MLLSVGPAAPTLAAHNEAAEPVAHHHGQWARLGSATRDGHRLPQVGRPLIGGALRTPSARARPAVPTAVATPLWVSWPAARSRIARDLRRAVGFRVCPRPTSRIRHLAVNSPPPGTLFVGDPMSAARGVQRGRISTGAGHTADADHREVDFGARLLPDALRGRSHRSPPRLRSGSSRAQGIFAPRPAKAHVRGIEPPECCRPASRPRGHRPAARQPPSVGILRHVGRRSDH